MSFSLHAGHYAHSLVKAFVQGGCCWGTETKRRFLPSSTTSRHIDNNMPSRSSRVKREPVTLDDDGDLLQTYVDVQPQSHHTTEMPVRAASVTSAAGPATNGDGDVDMSDGNGTSGTSGTSHTDGRIEDAAAHALAGRSRQLIQTIQKLEALNIDATLESLPQFVVIGDQSAGKSSIIEAVSDITIPRSAGTCTRCPFKITTTATKDGESWSCEVTLQRKFAYDPHGRARSDQIFPGWTEDETELIPFSRVTDKTQLELTLRRAQLAILNPHKDPSLFKNISVNNSADEKQKVGFSPNVISLQVAAPGLPDLSFYDLPGAINAMGDEEEQHLVKFVEKLVTSYIEKDKVRVLLACAANQDLETSTALRYLIETRAQGRAMGVLTKPDLMDSSPQRIPWLQSVLSGKHYKLGDGWFVTRQLAQHELEKRTTYDKAREIEKTFFSKKPWNTPALSIYDDRLGIANLQKALSEKLIQHIIDNLPEIVAQVQDRLSEVNSQLALYPEEVSDPSLSVMMEVEQVKNALVQQINADSLRSNMRQEYRDVFRNMFKKLQSLKPRVNMTTPGYQKPSITVESSDQEEESPSKSRRTNNGRAMSVMSSNRATPNSSQKSMRRTPAQMGASQEASGRAIFRLDQVKKKFDKAPGADLPAQASESVVRDLISETLVGWASVTDAALKKIREVFTQMLDNVLASALAQRDTTEFFREVKRITFTLFEELFRDVEQIIHKLIAGETHRPMTYNDILKQKRAFHKAEYRKLRQEKRVAEYAENLEAETGKIIPSTEQKKKAADATWMASTLGPDEYEREIEALATPMAYYEIASAQLVDTVAKQFETGLMHAYESRINRKLMEDLQTTNKAHCRRLLAEDPERERQRAALGKERQKLEEAIAELNTLPATHLPN